MKSPFKYKLVIVLREDLKMSPGKAAAQAAHAAVICSIIAYKERKPEFKAWWEEGQKKVVLGAKGEEELIKLGKKAKKLGLITTIVQDAGMTELPPGTVTALGVGPGPEAVIDKVTGSLPLYRGSE